MKNVSSYFSIRTIQTSTCMEFNNLNEFCQFTKAHQVMDIFLLLNAQNEAEYFGAIHNHVLFRHSTMGFKTLEDYHTAVQHQFPNANTFYEAKAQGYAKYEDYRIVKECGINDKAMFEKIKAAQFITGFEDYKTWAHSKAALAGTTPFINPYQLYSFATENGFENYDQFKKGIENGFTDFATSQIANEHGFNTCADYKDAIQRGFRYYRELQYANEKGARDRADVQRLLDLDTTACNHCTHDQKVLLSLLSKLEQGKKISLNKLKDLMCKATEEYKYEDSLQMPAWFTTSLHTDEALVAFLQKNEAVKAFGEYDADGEFFEINQMQDRSVVIDGSNVAHNSKGDTNSKPSISNIIKVVEHLKANGFSEITVIVDASLKYRLQDAAKIAELEEMADYLESPGETPADIFIINYVKRNHCLLVSNDTYREWKVQDPWIAQNIDFYRLTFMIKGEQVLMPDLK